MDVFVVVHVPTPELKLLLRTAVGKVPAPVRLIVVPVQAEGALLVADTPVGLAFTPTATVVDPGKGQPVLRPVTV